MLTYSARRRYYPIQVEVEEHKDEPLNEQDEHDSSQSVILILEIAPLHPLRILHSTRDKHKLQFANHAASKQQCVNS